MKLQELGEFGLIARLRRRWGRLSAGVVVGPGDDAAAVTPVPGRLFLLTVDAMLEEVHFRRRWMPPRDLGWKAMAQSISDIAAMGGQPTYALVCLALPADLDLAFVDELYEGLETAAGEFGATIIGGDIVGSAGAIAVSVSLAGETEEELLLRRSGARPGDVLMVTGTLGDAAAGLRLLEAGQMPAAGEELAVAAHLRPRPRVDEARLLARSGQVTAAIDVSDGLAGDATRMAEESGVGVRLHADRVPVGEACRRAAQRLGLDALDFVLRGGEDYELLVAVRPQGAECLAQQLRHEAHTELTAVGEIVEASEGIMLVTADGSQSPLGGAFDHLKETSQS